MATTKKVIVVDEEQSGILQRSLQFLRNATPFLQKLTLSDVLSGLLLEIPQSSFSSSARQCNPSQLRDGDIIIVHSISAWKTYGIVSSARERKVICFTTHDQCPVSDIGALCSLPSTDIRLREVGLDQLSRMNEDVVVIPQENTAMTLKNARDTLADAHEHLWSFHDFNSEHFVTGAMNTEEKQSPQFDTFMSVLMKAIATGALSELKCRVLRACSKCVVRKVKEISIIIVVATLKVVQVATTNGNKVAAISSLLLARITAKEVTEEVVEATATSAASRLARGAKAGLWGGTIVEGAFLTGSLYLSHRKMKQGAITKEEYEQYKTQRIVASGGSLAGGAVGSAIGTVIMPGVGTFIGSMLGGLVGDYLGSKCGESVYCSSHQENEECVCKPH